MEKVLEVSALKKKKNNHAAVAVLFFIFAYSPCYNIGNNALTYSNSSLHLLSPPYGADDMSSLSRRTFPLR